jgi:hypothetical protein
MSTSQEPPQSGLTELLARAVTDDQFRDQLFTDRAAAVRGYQLSRGDLTAVEHLDRGELEAAAQQVVQSGSARGSVRLAHRVMIN